MLPRASDKKLTKKIVASSQRPSVANVSLIGKSTIDLSKVLVNGQAVTLDTDAVNVIDSTPGLAQPGKAVVLDSSKNIEGISNIGVSELVVDGKVVTGTANSGATVSDSPYMNGIQPGTSINGKLMSFNSNKETSAGEIKSNSLVLNGGKSTTLRTTNIVNDDISFKGFELDSVVQVHTIANKSTMIGNFTGYPAFVYNKLGKVYLVSRQTDAITSSSLDYPTYVMHDIYASGGGSWLANAGANLNVSYVVNAQNCLYHEATDMHYIPVFRWNGGTILNLVVFRSSAGSASSLTWTSHTVLSITVTSTLMDTANHTRMYAPSIRWFAPLNSFVMMAPPTTTSGSRRSYSGLYTSSDGTSWTKLSTLPVTSETASMAVTSTHIFVFLSSNYIYYTTNGVNWTNKISTNILRYDASMATYFPNLDIIMCGKTAIKPADILAAPSSNFRIGNQHAFLGSLDQSTPYYYDSVRNLYYTSENCYTSIYDPVSGKVIRGPGDYVDGFSLLVDYNNSTFASNKSFKFAITFPKTESHAIIDPSTFMLFESNRNIIYDFAWAPAISKYIAIGVANDGFLTAYSSNVSVYHSSDMENFEFIRNLPATNMLEMAYNSAINGLYVYNRTTSNYYVSYDYGLTFTLVTTTGIVTSICYEPMLKSTIFTIGTTRLVLSYGVNSDPTSDTASNSIVIPFDTDVNVTYIPRIMYVFVNRVGSGTYYEGTILAFINGYGAAYQVRTGLIDSIAVSNTYVGSSYALYPRFGQTISINPSYSMIVGLESKQSTVVPGVIMSNIEYIDALNIYVCGASTASNGESTNKFLYSYDLRNWVEPLMNNLSFTSVSQGAMAMRYDRRSGYLYVCGTNGLFRTIHSTKGFSPLEAPISWESILPWPLGNVTDIVGTDTTYARGNYLICSQNSIRIGSRYHSTAATVLNGDWKSIAASNTAYVVVGDGIFSNTTGTWVSRLAGTWNKVEWSPEVSAFGAAGLNSIALSNDGINWTTTTLTGNWASIKYHNGLWMAVRNGQIAYSNGGAFSTYSITGNWKDFSFGGQWMLVGDGVCAFSNKINDPTDWTVSIISGNYNSVHYIDNSRAFFLSGSRYAFYKQDFRSFEFYDSLASTSCRWNYRMQCFILTTSSGIKHTRVMSNGLDSALCLSEESRLQTASNSTNEHLFTINETGGAALSNMPISIASSTNSEMLSLENKLDGSKAALANRPDYMTWECDRAFNLSAEYLIAGTGFTTPAVVSTEKLQYMNMPTLGTTTGNNYLSVDQQGKLTTGTATANGLIVGNTLFCRNPPSSLTGMTEGSVTAGKGLTLNSLKEITGANQLTTNSLDLGYVKVNTSDSNTDIEKYANGQGSLDPGNYTILNCTYNKTLNLYAAAIDNTNTNNSHPVNERAYIIISKDGLSWHRSYVGHQCAILRVITVEAGTSLANAFNLAGMPGFIVILSASNFVTRALFTPDGVNYYSPNMQTAALIMDTVMSTSSLFYEVDALAVSSCILINNSQANPNRILRVNTTGLNLTWTSTVATNNYIWASEYAPNSLWGVTSANTIVTHNTGDSTPVSAATGEACKAACVAWNLNNTTSFNRIIVTASGKVLYGNQSTTSTSVTVTSAIFNCCAYNSVLRRFIAAAANGEIYLSAQDSMSSWTAVTLSNGFAESWVGCAPAGSKGFILWHDNSGSFISRKIATVSATGVFTIGTSSFEVALGTGCFAQGNYVIPINNSGNSEKIMYSPDGAFWEYSLVTTANISKVIHTGQYFLAATNQRTILKSTDLINWTSWTGPSGIAFRNIISTPTRAVVFFSGGTNCIAHSTDGTNWTFVTIPQFTSGVTAVAYSESLNRFVISGDITMFPVYSTDLITFTQCLAPSSAIGTDFSISTIAYYPESGRFISFGNRSQVFYWTSLDGITWVKFEGMLEKTNSFVSNIFMSNVATGKIIATVPGVGDFASIGFSPDGPSVIKFKNSEMQIVGTIPGAVPGDDYNTTLYNPDKQSLLIYKSSAGSRKGAYFQIIDIVDHLSKVTKEIPVDYLAKTYSKYTSISSALQNITQVTTLTTGTWDVFYSKAFSRFCAFKKTNTTANDTQQMFSLNGYTWAVDTNSYTSYDATSRTSNVFGYAEIPRLDTVITCRGTAFIQIISPAGLSQLAISGIGNVVAVSYIPATKSIAIVGSTNYMLASITNAMVVNQQVTAPLPTTSISFSDIIQCNGLFLLVSRSNTASYYYSNDLRQWTVGTLPAAALWKFTSQDKIGRVVAVSDTGIIAYSDNAVNWTTALTSSNQFGNVKYFSEQRTFVACNLLSSNLLHVSTDAATWQTVTIPSNIPINDVVYSPAHDSIVIIATDASVYISIPKAPMPGNVLKFAGTNTMTSNFKSTSKGGILMSNRAYSNFTGNSIENQPLIALDTNSAYKPSSSSWTVFSDRRIKDDIQQLDDEQCLQIIKKIPLKYYKWADSYAKANGITDMHKIGWIAQDVELDIPTAISDIGDYRLDSDIINNLKTINTDQLIVCMNGAIRALIKRYKDLKQTLESI